MTCLLRRVSWKLRAGAICSALIATSSNLYAQAPQPGSVSIEQLSYSGSGCRQGSVGSYLSDDNKAFTLIFDDYFVDSEESGNGFADKNCTVNLKLKAPRGWSYALFCVDFRGFVDLDPGVRGRMRSMYRFGNRPLRQLAMARFQGPVSEDYSKISALPLGQRQFSNCNPAQQQLVIRTNAVVNAANPRRLTEKRLRCSAGNHPQRGCALPGPVVEYGMLRHHGGKCSRGETFEARGKRIVVREGCDATFRVFYRDPQKNLNQPAVLGGGLLTMDTVDGEVQQHYGVAWRRCR